MGSPAPGRAPLQCVGRSVHSLCLGTTRGQASQPSLQMECSGLSCYPNPHGLLIPSSWNSPRSCQPSSTPLLTPRRGLPRPLHLQARHLSLVPTSVAMVTLSSLGFPSPGGPHQGRGLARCVLRGWSQGLGAAGGRSAASGRMWGSAGRAVACSLCPAAGEGTRGRSSLGRSSSPWPQLRADMRSRGRGGEEGGAQGRPKGGPMLGRAPGHALPAPI